MKYIGLIFIVIMMIAFSAQSQGWVQTQQIVEESAFAIDIAGNYAIVGDIDNATDENNQNDILRAGAAFIYIKDASGNWSLAQKIVASDRSATDGFGVAVAISADGLAVVGTQSRETAYAFRLEGNQWVEVQKITPPIFQNEDNFGRSIAIHEDKMVIGAPFRRISDTERPGAAYLYSLSGATDNWVEVTEIPAPNSEDESFGFDVDISTNFIVIGAPNHDGPGGEINIGAAYIFTANTGQLENILDFPLLQPGDKFGASVAISGTTVFAGIEAHALNEEGADDMEALNDGLLHPGMVGIFSGATWALQKLVSPNRTPNGQFGYSVDVWNDTAIIGANQEGLDAEGANFKSFAGAAYILQRTSGGAWSISQKVTPANREAFDKFGTRVGLSGNSALVLGEEKALAFKNCSEVAVPDIESTSTEICKGQSVSLAVSGDNIEATNWYWHAADCGGPVIHVGTSIEVIPNETTTYFLRNGDRCNTPFDCKNITIDVVNNIELTANIMDEQSGNDGSIDLTVSGGTVPYEFDWDVDGVGDWDDTEDLSDLSAGLYTVNVQDVNGCLNGLSVELTGGTITSLSESNFQNEITIYPNPAVNGHVKINMDILPAKLLIKNPAGKTIYALQLNDTPINLDHLPKGLYLLQFVMKGKLVHRRLLIP